MMTVSIKQNTFNCLHIGCGLKVIDGWINIDASPSLRLSKIPFFGSYLISYIKGPEWSTKAEYGDIAKGLDIANNSCELIFMAHVLEHLSKNDFYVALNNIYSYLKPGGIFRTIVPDLEYYVNNYIERRSNIELSSQAAHEFMQSSLVGNSGSRASFYQRFREAFSNSRHQWMWDEPSLTEAFVQQGFKNIKKCNYGDWSDSRFKLVETEKNYLGAICIEGIK